jgi:DNA mismatch repair protein MutS2
MSWRYQNAKKFTHPSRTDEATSPHVPLLSVYHAIVGEFDFIRAKAAFAIDIHGEYPVMADKAHVHLVKAYHHLLYLYNSAPANKRFR